MIDIYISPAYLRAHSEMELGTNQYMLFMHAQ